MSPLLGAACGVRGPSGADDDQTQPDPGLDEATEADSDAPADLPPAVDSCAPTGGGPHWILELETVEFQLRCSTGLDLPPQQFSVGSLPLGAVYDAESATLSWTPDLDQGSVYTLELSVPAFEESGVVTIGVADRFDDPANVPVLDPTTYTEEYGLPVLHLDNDPALNSDAYSPAVITYRGHVYFAESKLRGASSLGYPKNSYTLKFTKEDKFTDPEVIDGFLEKRKIVLTSTFDDNTYLRQRLAFELWNRLDPGHIQVQAYNGVVFLDGKYWGLYLIGDHIDGYLMEDHGLLQDGDLFKARTHDANFRLTDANGNPKGTPHQGLTKSEGFPIEGEAGAFDDLDELITFVATALSSEFLAQVDSLIDRRDYEDWWIFVTAISAGDSAGKNAYHYHDPAGRPLAFHPLGLQRQLWSGLAHHSSGEHDPARALLVGQ